MRPSRAEIVERERRWAVPTAIATLAAIGLVLAAVVVATQSVGTGHGDAALLRSVDRHRTAQIVSSILQAIGVGLLAVPLLYLFRAAQARSTTMRGQLVGVVVAAPLFLSALAVLSGISTLDAATSFVAHVAGSGTHADKLATDAINNAQLRSLAAGFGLAGQLGFLIAMVYTCLHAMRVGLLSRFWGSLGIALGAVSFIFFQFAMLWFVYLAILLLRRRPDSRPPAWTAGEAVPWPSPGEKAASGLGGGGLPERSGDGDASDVTEADAEEASAEGTRRKRKQRAD